MENEGVQIAPVSEQDPQLIRNECLRRTSLCYFAADYSPRSLRAQFCVVKILHTATCHQWLIGVAAAEAV